MIHPARITELLSHPGPLAGDDLRSLEHVAIRYPYFTPARLLLDAHRHALKQSLHSLLANPVMVSGHLPVRVLKPIIQAAPATPAAAEKIIEETPAAPPAAPMPEEAPTAEILPDMPPVQPVFTEDYFRYEGIEVPGHLPEEKELTAPENEIPEEGAEKDKALMVMMNFKDWLLFYKHKSQAAREDEADKNRLKTAWQREKLAAALENEEEEDEIPEQVFEMAVNSIAHETGLVSESLAAILAKQGKTDKAIEMYRKLSLKHPQKSAYFATQIETLLKNKDA